MGGILILVDDLSQLSGVYFFMSHKKIHTIRQITHFVEVMDMMKFILPILLFTVSIGIAPQLYSQNKKNKKKASKKTTTLRVTPISDVKIANDGLTVLYGGSMVEKLQEEGSFESYMQLANAGQKVQFRSCAYVGDEVNFRIRASRFGLHLKYLLEQWNANRVIMAFGANESHAGAKGLAAFEVQLGDYLKLIKSRHGSAELILVSPTAAENVSAIQSVDISQRNSDLKLYSDSMKKLAEKYKLKFVDLYTPTADLFKSTDAKYTSNTHNLTIAGSETVGKLLASAISGAKVDSIQPSSTAFKSVQKMVQRKALEVAQAYHPANGISYYGLRKRTYEYNTEIPHHLKLANIIDEAIWKQAKAPASAVAFPKLPIYKLKTLPNSKPKNGLGKIKPSKEDLKDFTVAKGFSINCFASSEDHPELINPLQMQFDSKGRLWVTCFSSYPHPVPGTVSNDTILIFEDTNHDGKADKKTIFSDGLDLPDGFVFYKNGIVAATARKLVYLEDTDGDSKADIREEVLRGFDNTDTHHSGYLQRSPHGDITLSEALFHRGQFETPHGVVRTKDSAVMTLDMDTKKLTVERQIEAPNPWKITHNKWGESIQSFGGGQILDSEIHNVAAPMGSSAPTELGMPFRYDKGVSAVFVNSPSFPKEWQGGILTTHLLTKNEINFTPLKLVNGAYKASDEKVILVESSNKIFRPTDIVFGHDGALYISDFYYPIIGHAQHSVRHKDRDYASGRVWRRKPREEVNIALKTATKSHTTDDLYALELLWLMERQKNFSDTSLIKRLVKSSNIEVKRSAVRSLRWWADALGSDLDAIASKLTSDSDDRVKMGLITVLSHLQLKDSKWSKVGEQIISKGNTPLSTMKDMLTWVNRPGLAPEFPILSIAKEAYIPKSMWQKGSAPMTGYFYLKSDQDALLNIGHENNAFLNITTNDTPLLIASGGPHSKESQNSFKVKKGINKIQYSVLNAKKYKSRVNEKFNLYIADKTGNKPDFVTYPNDKKLFASWQKEFDAKQAENWKEFAVQTFKVNCANCHQVDAKAVGPSLTGLLGKKQNVVLKDGSKKAIVIDEEYIRRAIVDPLAEYPEGFQPVMVKMPLNEKEVEVLVRWIKELK